MAREIIWTEPAAGDLEAAAEYIARDSESYAATFVRDVKDAAESLSEFGERGQVVPELDDDSIRERLLKPYRLIYRIHPDRVVILALVHGARRAWRT